MRGDDKQQDDLFSYGSLEERVSAGHPLRAIRTMVDEALAQMSSRFDEIYPEDGRRSIPPERLLRALLLQMLYSVRSERMLMEQMEYNLLFRWFVGLSANEPVWHPTVFTKNRDRLLEGAVAEEFFSLIVRQARSRRLLSDEQFTVDGTLIEAWAGQKSFQRKDRDHDPLNPPPPGRGGNPTVNWHKEKRSNQTHESLTDAMARLYKKTRGAEARLGYLGHVMTENRNGLVVDVRLTQATGTAEREAALAMLDNKAAWQRITLGGDRGYDTRGFIGAMRERKVTPHVAQNDSNRRSAIDGRTTRHDGYAVSQRKRKRVEEVFGWMKTVALQRKTGFVDWNAWAGCSLSRLQPTTWYGCAIFRLQTHRRSVPGGPSTRFETYQQTSTPAAETLRMVASSGKRLSRLPRQLAFQQPAREPPDRRAIGGGQKSYWCTSGSDGMLRYAMPEAQLGRDWLVTPHRS